MLLYICISYLLLLCMLLLMQGLVLLPWQHLQSTEAMSANFEFKKNFS